MSNSGESCDNCFAWEDEESHQPQFLPSPDTQQQMTFVYNTNKYDFRELIIDIFKLHCPGFAEAIVNLNADEILSKIHLINSETPIRPNRSIYHAAFNNIKNAKSEEELDLFVQYEKLLLLFVREVVAPLMHEAPDNIIYQRHPTLRVSLPSDKPMGVPHTDYEYHHMPSEVNIWIPLTNVFGSNTLYTESRPNANDYKPVEMCYGEGLRFWGNKCRHYTIANTTDVTRVSLDFRVIARNRYNPKFVDMKGRCGGLFHVGQYYSTSSNTDHESSLCNSNSSVACACIDDGGSGVGSRFEAYHHWVENHDY